MKSQIYKKLILVTLFTTGGFFVLSLINNQVAFAVSYECRCQGNIYNYFDSANDSTAYSQCVQVCGSNSSVSYVAANGCQSAGNCDANQICQNGFCVAGTSQNAIQSGNCNPSNFNSCPSGNACVQDPVDQTWNCEPVVATPPPICVGSADCGMPGFDCINGQCVNVSGVQSGNDVNQVNSLTPIGNVIMPNFLGCSKIGVCITNAADFLINYIAIPLAVFMLVLAGFRYVTAGGNEEKIKVANRNFVWTAVGIGVIFASKMIILYIQDIFGNTSSGALASFIDKLKGTLNIIIGLLFSLVTVYFIWGVIQYVRSGGDEKALEQGKRHMVWGIIGMAIMAAAFAIVNLIKVYVQ